MMNDDDTRNMSIDEREVGDVPDFGALADEDSDEIMKDLAARVNSVSVADREAGLHDLHGIRDIEEKSDVEEQVLVNKMRLALSERYSSRAAEAFRVAESTSDGHTQDASFLLMFLRCDNYDLQAAVNRLFHFFQHKLRLFGPEKVGMKTIPLNDFSPNDIKSYSAGFFQLLPHRDHRGRAQMLYLPQFSTWETRENFLRVVFHLCMTVAMDEETQKKGAIGIIHALDTDGLQSNPQSRDPIALWEAFHLVAKAVPLRFVARHICTNPSFIGGKFFYSMARFGGETVLLRTRFHQGSFDEINEKLSSFGINNIQIAVSHSGEKKIEKHREQMKMIKALERAMILAPDKLVVLVPSTTDVLLGRGKPIQTHPGNVRLGLIVESQLAEYDEIATRQDKTKLAETTMAQMKEAGVRFLTKDNGYWEVAADRIARERVSSTFRTVRDRLKVNQRTTKAPADSNLARKRSIENTEETT